MTIWGLLENCVRQLDEPFRRSEIIGWFRRHHPEVLESSLAAHIQGATADAPGRGPFASRPPLVVRIDRGLYLRVIETDSRVEVRRTRSLPKPARTKAVGSHRPLAAVLVGCVKSKRQLPDRAADLYASQLFRYRRAYAERQGLPWYILSAEHGLLHPETLIEPYDRALAAQRPEYRAAWGSWVVAKLEDAVGELFGRSVEVHAGSAYVDALRDPLWKRSCNLDAPLRGLRRGEQLAWYSDRQGTDTDGDRRIGDELVEELVIGLADFGKSISPVHLLSGAHTSLNSPGLYSWWVDADGARDLSSGVECDVRPGLIYAGQAGATRWPSGRRSRNTLDDRLVGMHLRGNIRFSTFRRTLWAILKTPLALETGDEWPLSSWMEAHLRVVAMHVPNADELARTESTVLGRLDPPFNLAGRPATELRNRIRTLRRAVTGLE